MKVSKKILIAFITFISLFVVGLLVWNWLSFDSADVNDSDLVLEVTLVTKDQNLFFDLQNLGEQLRQTGPLEFTRIDVDDYFVGNTDAELGENIGAYLENNADLLHLLKEANKKPFYQVPLLGEIEHADFVNGKIYGDNSLALISNFIILKSYDDFREGRKDAAIENFLVMLDIWQKVENSPDTFLKTIGHLNVKEWLFRAFIAMINTDQFNLEQIRLIKTGLISHQTSDVIFANAMRVEYMLTRNTVNNIAKYWDGKNINFLNLGMLKFLVLHNYYFQPNMTNQLFADYYRTLVAGDYTLEEFDVFYQGKYEGPMDVLMTRNSIGESIFIYFLHNKDAFYLVFDKYELAEREILKLLEEKERFLVEKSVLPKVKT